MVSINPSDALIIKITKAEQSALLQHCAEIDDDIRSILFSSASGILTLTRQQCEKLRWGINIELDRVSNQDSRDLLSSIYNKLCPKPAIRDLVEQLGKESFHDLEHIQHKLDEMTRKQNNTPDPDLGGLSPNQVADLIHFSWDSCEFPIRFSKKLYLFDLQKSLFFKNTRIFLTALMQLQEQKNATVKGNLSRKTVQILLDQFEFEPGKRGNITRENKVLNEMDVWPIHIVKIICEMAGFIKKRSGKFYVVKKHQKLVAEENAGELYCRLFHTYFRKFNLSYGDRLPSAECIQSTIAYTFYRIGKIADHPVNMDNIESKIFLPAVCSEIYDENASPYFRMEWLIRARVIHPLEQFGLIKCYTHKYKGLTEIEKIQKTDLFDKFMTFTF